MKKFVFALICLTALMGCSSDRKPFVITNADDTRWVFCQESFKVRLRAYPPYKWELKDQQFKNAGPISVGQGVDKDAGWVPGDPVHYIFFVPRGAGHVYFRLVDGTGNEVQEWKVISAGR